MKPEDYTLQSRRLLLMNGGFLRIRYGDVEPNCERIAEPIQRQILEFVAGGGNMRAGLSTLWKFPI